MNYTLHKLPQGFIITSDEEIYESALKLNVNTLELDNNYGNQNNTDWRLVIAQEVHTDFSALSEEEKKKIGWFDLESAASKYAEYQFRGISDKTEMFECKTDFLAGFLTAQELLSNGRFTMEDIYNAYGMGNYHGSKITSIKQPLEEGFNEEEYKEICVENTLELHKFTSNLKNKSWKVELEMGFMKTDEDGQEYGFPDMSQPKLTNDKFKITKIL